MDNVVVDTSVAIKWFFPENGSDRASDLKTKHIKGEISICTRDLFLYEFTSAFKNYSSIKMDEKDFSLATAAIMSLKIKFYPLKYQELTELFHLSKDLDLSVYDCSYSLLAQKLKATFYTSDNKLFLKSKKLIKTVLV